jgi:hypothetical protein
MPVTIGRREFRYRRRGSCLAARYARARAGNAGDRVPRCRSSNDSPLQVAAFHRGLADTGYFEGQSVVNEFRWAEGR